MKRIEPTLIDNKFPPNFMADFIDEFERVMKAREVLNRERCADFLGLSTSTVDKLLEKACYRSTLSLGCLVVSTSEARSLKLLKSQNANELLL